MEKEWIFWNSNGRQFSQEEIANIFSSDEDTLPMIHVFEARLHDGKFVSSRFTSYPVSEIGIGFLSYYLGSWAANSA